MSIIADLSPWQVASVFSTPKVRNVAVNVTAAEVAPADGTRWALIFASPPGLAVQVGVLPSSAISSTFSITVSTSQLPLVITQDQWGPLVQAQWFGITIGGAANLPVIEIPILSWPTEEGRKIILPWQLQEQRQAEREAAAMKANIARLREAMRQCGAVSPRWLSNGD